MKTFSFLLSALLLHVSLSKAQTTLPYFTGFDNTTQKTGWQEFRKGNADPFYKWIYSTTTAYSAPASLSHQYPVGGNAVTDDWFVSPGFSILTGGRVDSIRSAFSGFGLPSVGDTVAIYLLKGSPDPALATAKTLLLDYRGANYSNNSTWTTNTLSLAAATGTCYLAVRYKTVNNWLDVNFDHIKISANVSTSIRKHTVFQQEMVVLYPNPASEELRIKFDHQQTAPVFIKIYNTLGELQIEQKMLEQEPLHLDLKNGVYFYTIVRSNGSQLNSGKLMIQNR
jgi:hypothetical protein